MINWRAILRVQVSIWVVNFMIDKQKHREFRLQVAKIFFEEWDPIGIKDFSDSYDEYDNYVGTVCAKIWEGEGKEDILEYMFWAQSEYMGLGGVKKKLIKPIN